MNTGMKKRKTSNFGNDFLKDFRLHYTNEKFPDGTYAAGYEWVYSQKALERFHLPITYKSPNGSEGPKHYGLKQMVHDYIYENYYLFVVTLNNTIVLSNFCPGNTTVHMDEQQGRTPALKKLHRTIR